MSIVIHFGPASVTVHQSNNTPMIPATTDETHKSLAMGPGLENNSGFSIMSADDSSIVDVSTTNLPMCIEKESVISIPQHAVGTCFGLPYQDHNYGAPPPPTPPCNSPRLSPVHMSTVVETEAISVVTSSSEEVHEASVTRCICGYEHDDEYMICCDRCLVWQHVDCMGLDRSRMPETYLCEQCQPRKVDRHKAKLLQTKKKVVLPVKLVFTETSEESEEDRNNQTTDVTKTRLPRSSSRKRTEEERDIEQVPLKKAKLHPKHVKDRMEIKRSRLHRKTKTRVDCVYAAVDEEAQDPWKCSTEWQRRRSDANSPHAEDVHSMTGVLRTPGEDPKFVKQLQAQLCQVVDNRKLVATCDLTRDQMIIEFKGQFMSAPLFHEKNPTFKYSHYPHVLFYKLRSNEELCVDATDCKTDAKYVRRSCTPNSEVHHFVFSNSLHLYILSIKEIKKDEEITIPFDSSFKDSTQDLECACNTDKCRYAVHPKQTTPPEPSERMKRTRRRTQMSTDEDSNQSLGSCITSPTKSVKTVTAKSPVPKAIVSPVMVASESNESKALLSEDDNAEISDKKKLTREERKLNAIMKAFDQMEKAAKRRQQALDRMANQKAGKPDEPGSPEKVDVPVSAPVKEEDKTSETTPAPPSVETTSVEEEKPTTSTSGTSTQPTKPKKGKRRRGSGASTRKRTRTNSGGSDVFTTDDASAGESTTNLPTPTTPHDVPELTLLPSHETTTAAASTSPVTPCTTSIFPKTKRYLHHEWLQERVESAPINPVPASTHTETGYNATTYIQCIKDSPTAGGISAAHMRRSSIVGHGKQTSGQGSAKKRWLRQAMYDCEPWETDVTSGDGINGDGSPIHSACFSPNRQSDAGSPGVLVFDDVITPLKKRRLLRKSLESLLSPKSPNTESTGTSSGMSPDHSSCELNTELLSNGTCLSIKDLELVNTSHSKNFVEKCVPAGNGLGKHLLKSLREKWILDDIKTKAKSCEMETDIHKSPEGSAGHAAEASTDIGCAVNSENASDSDVSVPRNENCKEQLEVDEENKTEQTNTEAKHVVSNSTCENVDEGAQITTENLDNFANTSVIVSLPLCKISDNPNCEENESSRVVEKVELLPEDCVFAVGDHIDVEHSKRESALPVTDNENTELKMMDKKNALLSPAIGESYDCNVQSSSDAQKIVYKENSSGGICSCPVNMLNSRVVVSPLASSLPLDNDDRLNILGSKIVPTRLEAEHTQIKTIPKETPKEVFVSAMQRRKVSLSEYRQRKRDNPSTASSINTDKAINNNCVLQQLDLKDSLKDEEIKLAALPLFEKADATKTEKQESKLTNAKVKSAEGAENSQECHSGRGTEHRENLSDRLKREFGLDDGTTPEKEDTSKHKSHLELPPRTASVDVNPMLTLCQQYPPPTSAPIPHVNSNGSIATQFGYPSIQQTPFVGAQLPSGQFMGSLSAIHPGTIQPSCAYGATMHMSVPRPPFPSLPPRLPPMPPSYPTSFPSRVYK